MIKKFFVFSTLVACLLLPFPASAAEVIDDFTVTVKINPDASIEVTEEIIYDFGAEQKHGIYRDIQYGYKMTAGNLKMRLKMTAVEDGAGNPYRYEISNKGNYKSVKIGDPDVYVTGKNKYILRYRMEGAISRFDDHDELYWNVTGNGRSAVISQAKATVILSAAVSDKDLRSECFAGPAGSADPCVSDRFVYSGPDAVDRIVFASDRLDGGEGLTAVVGFPAGMVEFPSAYEKITDALRGNWFLGLPLPTFIALFYFWRARGRGEEI